MMYKCNALKCHYESFFFERVEFGFNEDFKTGLEQFYRFKEKPAALIFSKGVSIFVFFYNLYKI